MRRWLEVLAVIDVRAAQETERSRKRHERMARVLKAAGIHVHVWREGELPSVLARAQRDGRRWPGRTPRRPPSRTPSRPMPLIPVADIAEILADGDRAAMETDLDASMEPVPSAFFDEFETAASPR